MKISSTYHIIIPVLIPLECPACHMRYDLAKGGSIHFQCTRCSNEFCGGCGVSFKNPKVWKTFDISVFCKCCNLCTLKLLLLKPDASHSAEVSENINLGYSQDQGYS